MVLARPDRVTTWKSGMLAAVVSLGLAWPLIIAIRLASIHPMGYLSFTDVVPAMVTGGLIFGPIVGIGASVVMASRFVPPARVPRAAAWAASIGAANLVATMLLNRSFGVALILTSLVVGSIGAGIALATESAYGRRSKARGEVDSAGVDELLHADADRVHGRSREALIAFLLIGIASGLALFGYAVQALPREPVWFSQGRGPLYFTVVCFTIPALVACASALVPRVLRSNWTNAETVGGSVLALMLAHVVVFRTAGCFVSALTGNSAPLDVPTCIARGMMVIPMSSAYYIAVMSSSPGAYVSMTVIASLIGAGVSIRGVKPMRSRIILFIVLSGAMIFLSFGQWVGTAST